MLKQYQGTIADVFRVVDALVVTAAWLLSYWLRFHLVPIALNKGLPPFDTYAALSSLIAVLWITVFTLMHVYESQRLLGRLNEVQLILKAHGMAMLCFIAITYMFEEYKYSRFVMGYFALLSSIALTLFRVTLRTMLRRLRARGLNLRHVLAVGEGPTLEAMIDRLDRFPELGLRCSGVITAAVDDGSHGAAPRLVCGKPVLGSYDQVRRCVRETHADEVLVAMPASHYAEMDHVLDQLSDEMVSVRVIPSLDRFVTLGCEIENFDGMPVVRLNDSPLEGWGSIAKRLTDMVVATAALLLLSPVLLVIGWLVKLTSPGPMLYSQERMGLDGHTFRMLKFRSMSVDAEANSGAVWAQKIDNRRTSIGTFLRKTSIDELPQLWNVVRGDMALVGPRPERPVFVNRFRSEIPHYMLRHKVKSGITGWAQVNGWRGNTSLDSRIECDLFYIRNWSYVLDLKILTMTLWKGFLNKNAY